jgi:tetratricopeptide (TPR) repeat protein
MFQVCHKVERPLKALIGEIEIMAASSRFRRILSKAEGYLQLEMPAHALAALSKIDTQHQSRFLVQYLHGMVYRDLKQYDEALRYFQQALTDKPESVEVLLAMAWCYKRIDRLDEAISTMEQAYRVAPLESIVLYNIACYWSLAGDKENALSWLGRALRMDQDLRKLIDDEPDFDTLRHDPDFEMIVSNT